MSEFLSQFGNCSEDEKIRKILEVYGDGFDDIYRDGIAECRAETSLEIAKNCLVNGVSADIICRCTGVSISEIKKLKREL